MCNVTNVVFNYCFIWQLEGGFIGSPIATSASRVLRCCCSPPLSCAGCGAPRSAPVGGAAAAVDVELQR